MQPSPNDWPLAPPPPPAGAPRDRGVFLSGVLVLGMFGNIAGIAGYLLLGAAATGAEARARESLDNAAALASRHLSTTMHLLALLAFANVVFLTGVWMWKKWGVYGYGAFSLIGTLAGLKSSPIAAFVGLAWFMILAVKVAGKWNDFE